MNRIRKSGKTGNKKHRSLWKRYAAALITLAMLLGLCINMFVPAATMEGEEEQQQDKWAPLFENTELTGVWADDLVTIANTQKGYAESTDDYIVVDEDTHKGYTMFGEFINDRYADWNAAFVAFCLKYAEIPDTEVLRADRPVSWAAQLANRDLLKEKGAYEPKAGDLVFIAKEEIPVPEETTPAEIVPEETTPEEIIPEETTPEEIIPEETTPEEIIVDETPAEDMPEETTADDSYVEDEPEVTAPAEEETTPQEPQDDPAEPVEGEDSELSPSAGRIVPRGVFMQITHRSFDISQKTRETIDKTEYVGIVTYVDKQNGKISVLIGDYNNTVKEVIYDLKDEKVFAFFEMPKNPALETPEVGTTEDPEVAAEPDSGIFAVSWAGLTNDAMLDVVRIAPEDELFAQYAKALKAELGDVEIFDILDIKLTEGAIATENGANITLSNYIVPASEKLALYHIKDDGTVEELEYVAGEKDVSFVATSFSPFIFAEKADDAEVKVVEYLTKDALRGDDDEPADPEIDSFTTDFCRGATATPNGEVVDYVWNADNSYPDHRFTFRVTYSISGKFDYEPEGIEILVPASILIDRNGNPADYYEMSLPYYNINDPSDPRNETGLTEKNVFVYYEVEIEGKTYIRIYNRLPITVADSGYIEISYLTSETTYEYADYDPQESGSHEDANGRDKNGSNPFFAIINLDRTIDGVHDEAHERTDSIPVYINTNAKVTNTNKDKPAPERQVYSDWNNSWGQYPNDGTNPSDYYYIVWEIRTVINNTTQPYNFYIRDDFSPWGEPVKYKMQGGHGWTNPVNGHSEVIENLKEDFKYGRYDYVVTRHPKTYYEDTPENGSYTVKNWIYATVDPIDQVDPDTTVKDDRQWTHYKYSFNPPYGHFYMYKWGFDINDHYTYDYDDIRRYDMTAVAMETAHEPKDTFEIDNLKYYTYIHGYPYPWTLEEGASSFIPANYGKETVTYELTDNQFYLKWVGDSAYSHQLTADDYKIESITLSYQARDVELSADGTEFIYKDKTTYLDGEVIWILAQFDSNSRWVPMGYYDLNKPAASAFTDLNSTYVDTANSSYNYLRFKDSVNCTGYKLVTKNAHYYTLLGAYPVAILKSSDLVKDYIRKAYADHYSDGTPEELNRVEIQLKNTAVGKTYDNHAFELDGYRVNEDYRIVTFYRDGIDYVAGFQREGRIDKDYVAYSNDTINRECTYTWNVDIREVFTDTSSNEYYVHQSNGVIYELLPAGSHYKPDSAVLTKYDGAKTASNEGTVLSYNSDYVIDEIRSYKDDRDLLIIRILEDADWYNLQFSTIHSWDSIIADCDIDDSTDERIMTNDVAYKSGNVDIGPEAPENTDDDHRDLFSEFATGDDADNFIYASATHDIGVPLAASLSIHKKVVGNSNRESYSDFTNVGSDYMYVYTYGTDKETIAKDLIIYDSLENYVKGTLESGWHGTLKSIDLSNAEKLGIVPVVYYSEVEGLEFSALTSDLSGNYDLTNTSIWHEAGPTTDLSVAKAIAIDLRWANAARTEEFVMPKDNFLRISITMTAPDYIDLETNREAYNNVFLHSTVGNDEGGQMSTSNIHQDYTTISLRTVGEFRLYKIDETNENPIGRVYFRLKGNGIDTTPHTNNSDGFILFENLLPGTYTLQEVSAPNDYVVNPVEMTIVVDEAGHVHIVNGDQMDTAGVYDNIYAVETDPDGGVVSITVSDPPRVHGDLIFVKVGTMDGSTATKPLGNVIFHLQSDGRTDYGTLYSEDRTSDESNGKVVFENLDKGKYFLTEIETIDGYILSTTEYTVIVDEMGMVSITYLDGNEQPVMVPQNADTGEYEIINNPYHTLKLLKVDEVSKESLDGAEFTLTGPEPSTDAVTAVAGESEGGVKGLAEFKNLKAGTYKLQETKAPPHHDLNPTEYKVVIADDGTVTITYKYIEEDGTETVKTLPQSEEGFWFVITDPRILESTLTILKVWSDPENPNHPTPDVIVSTEEPVIENHYATIDYNVRTTMSWRGDGYSSTDYRWFYDYTRADTNGGGRWKNSVRGWLTTATSFVRNSTAVMQKEKGEKPETVKDQNDNVWTRIDTDDDTTDCTIYARKNGTTVEWWSDAAIIYFPKNAAEMFKDTSIATLDLSPFNTSKTEDIAAMFYSADNLTSVDTTGWDTSNIKYMDHVFYECKKLTSVSLNHWDTSSVLSLAYMFYHNDALASVSISSWKTGNVIDMDRMFGYCSILPSVDMTPTASGAWDTSNVKVMRGLFRNTSKLSTVSGLSSWKTQNVLNAAEMFNSATGFTTLNVTPDNNNEVWYMGNCKNMQYMFAWMSHTTSITGLDKWQTQSAMYTNRMFWRCWSLQSLTLDHIENTNIWDVSNVINMEGMFECEYNATGKTNCMDSALTSISVKNWNLNSCTNIGRMFAGDFKLKVLDLHTWTNVGTNVASLYMGQTFSNMNGLNGDADHQYLNTGVQVIIIGNWDVSKVSNMYALFGWDYRIKRIYVGEKFDTTVAAHLEGISFSNGSKLYGPFVTSNIPFDLHGGMNTAHTQPANEDNGTAEGKEFLRIDQGPSSTVPGYLTNITQINNTWPNNVDRNLIPEDLRTNAGGNGGNSAVLPEARIDVPEKSALHNTNAGSRNLLMAPARRTDADETKDVHYDPDPNDPNADPSDVASVTYTSDDEAWIKNEDGTWTYNFDVYSGDATYYVWEEPLNGYETDHGRSNPIQITVHYDEETGRLSIINAVPEDAVVNIGTEDDPIYALQIKNTKTDEHPAGLKVKKTVTVNGVPVDHDSTRFSFKVTIWDKDNPTVPYAMLDGDFGAMTFIDGVATFTLAHDESIAAAGLPVGYRYTVEETLSNGYTVSYSGETGELEADVVKVVEVTNNRTVVVPKTGDMQIEKVVKYDADDAPVASKTFTFKVTLSGNGASEINGYYGEAYFENGVATVSMTLTPEQMTGAEAAPVISITKLPEGLTYTVEEIDLPYGYDPNGITITRATGTIVSGETNVSKVVVQNTKINVPKGGFKIVKRVDGSYHEEVFTVNVKLTGLEQGVKYSYKYNKADGTTEVISFEAEVTGGKYLKLTLTDGESYEFEGLPADGSCTYLVSEEASDYIASYVVTDGSDVVDSFDNQAANRTITINERVVTVGEDITVTFINHSPDYLVKIIKATPAPDNMFVEGATLQLFRWIDDDTKDLIKEWETTSVVYTTRLQEGKYIVHEANVPDGYLPAEDVYFIVDQYGKVYLADGSFAPNDLVTVVSVIDIPIKLKVEKVDTAGEPLKGALLQIIDKATGRAVDTWRSDGTVHEIIANPLIKINTEYYLHEKDAPAGYNLAEDIYFIIDKDGKVYIDYTINEDGTITGTECTGLLITMVDPDSFELPETGGHGTWMFTLAGLLLIMIALGCAFVNKKRRHE
ncbi:MAG: BspA family leucine-rich repeat surface protein [Lachnospiraceae bacterium]|nr:BspA family leucine-rich repeat surface protein [Lachnospiraceae bacterium]